VADPGFHHEEEQIVLGSGAFFVAYFFAEEVTKSIPGRLFSVMIYGSEVLLFGLLPQ